MRKLYTPTVRPKPQAYHHHRHHRHLGAPQANMVHTLAHASAILEPPLDASPSFLTSADNAWDSGLADVAGLAFATSAAGAVRCGRQVWPGLAPARADSSERRGGVRPSLVLGSSAGLKAAAAQLREACWQLGSSAFFPRLLVRCWDCPFLHHLPPPHTHTPHPRTHTHTGAGAMHGDSGLALADVWRASPSPPAPRHVCMSHQTPHHEAARARWQRRPRPNP